MLAGALQMAFPKYDFSSSKKGNYIIVFSSEGRTFKNNINIP